MCVAYATLRSCYVALHEPGVQIPYMSHFLTIVLSQGNTYLTHKRALLTQLALILTECPS